MNHTARYQKQGVTQAGFTVVECLIGLAISAMLMTALAVAFNASIINFRENEAMFESVNGARQALTRMTSQLRVADGVSAAAPSHQCVFWTGTSPSELLTYEYRSADSKLYLVKNASNQEYTLCDNVLGATFTKTQADGDPNDSKSVLISLTVRNGTGQRSLSSAAVVRRALAM